MSVFYLLKVFRMIKRYPKSGKRQIIPFIPSELITDSSKIVCVHPFVLKVAKVLLTERGVWPTTYSVGYNDNEYETPSSEQMNLIRELVANFVYEVDNMATCDELTSVLAQIRDSINGGSSSGCGCGSGGSGQNDEEPNTFDEITDFFPEGFDSANDYAIYKCNMANRIINELSQDLTWLMTVDLVTLTIEAAIIGFLTPIPGDAIALIVGGVLLMLAQGVAIAFLTTANDFVDNTGRTDLVCAIVSSSSSEDAMIALESVIDSSSLNATEKQFVKYFLTNTSVNRAFEYTNQLFDVDEDCSECLGYLDLDQGTIVSGDLTMSSGTLVIASVNPGGSCSKQQISVTPSIDYTMTITTTQSTNNLCSGGSSFTIFADECGQPLNSASVADYTLWPGTSLCYKGGQQIIFRSLPSDSFQITIQKGI